MRTAPLQGSNSETIRRDNLSAILREVHVGGPRTRSELVAHTGLNRSTVAGIIAELAERGLVYEEPGRPPRDARPALAAGQGGPRWRGRPRDRDRRPLARRGARRARRHRPRAGARGGPTRPPDARRDARPDARPEPDAAWRARRSAAASSASAWRPSVRSGARTGSSISHPTSIGRRCPWPSWWVARWSSACRSSSATRPTWAPAPSTSAAPGSASTTSSTSRATWASAAGSSPAAGRSCGAAGYAGEVGHFPVKPDGWPCGCGSRGCWETEVGERALLRNAGRDPDGGPDEVDALFRDAEAGAEVAVDGADRGRTLAGAGPRRGSTTCSTRRSSSSVVFSGGWPRSSCRPSVEQLDDRALAITREPVGIVVAQLGIDAPVLGADRCAPVAAQDDAAAALPGIAVNRSTASSRTGAGKSMMNVLAAA